MSTAAVQQGTKWWSGGKSPFNASYGKVMMWYFLMSDAFTFGAFLISYGTIRFSVNDWADPNPCVQLFSICRTCQSSISICKFNDLYFDCQFSNNGIGST